MKSSATPGTTIASLHSRNSLAPKPTMTARTRGVAICVTPPPRLPHPAVVALAVPITLGANIIDVWYCVMTKAAPMTSIPRRNSRNVS